MNTSEQKTKLEDLVKKLMLLGEDTDELNFWLETFETMDNTSRIKLLANLSEEVVTLENLEK